MFDIYEKMTQEEQERLKDIIGGLLTHTFLLEQTYDRKKGRLVTNKDYYFCDNHLEFLTQYFAVAGIRLCKNTELGSIYISGGNTVGERLPKLATIYLLLLKLIYDEKMAAASSSVNIVTSFGELNGKAGEFSLVRSLPSMTETRRAFALLRKYQMIELLDLPEELNAHTRIIIYPCINLVLMREDITGLLNSFSDDKKSGQQEKWGPDPEEEIQQEEPFSITEEGDTEHGELSAGI